MNDRVLRSILDNAHSLPHNNANRKTATGHVWGVFSAGEGKFAENCLSKVGQSPFTGRFEHLMLRISAVEMEESDTPIGVLHKFLENVERMINMEPQGIEEYKPKMLKLKDWILYLQQQASNVKASQQTQRSSQKLAESEEQELTALKSERAALMRDVESQDAQLLQLLYQLRRLQFSMDGMDPTVYQRPTQSK